MTAISLQQLREFTPQAIKDTLWAMATIGYTPAKPFLQGAADLCLRLIAQFNPQNIANAIWAFAKFNFNPGRYAMSASVSVPHTKLRAGYQTCTGVYIRQADEPSNVLNDETA